MTGSAPRLNRVGSVRVRAARQVRTVDQDAEPWATKHHCEPHSIDYYVAAGDRVRCPMCHLQRAFDETRAQALSQRNELDQLRAQMSRLQAQVDVQSAIRQALPLLDDNDYLWLKVQMYQYKIDKSLTLKVTHGRLAGGVRLRRGEKLPANGFMTVPRRGDPEAHMATSFGGLAIADYLDEAIALHGSAQAMGLMLKAWWKALPGGSA